MLLELVRRVGLPILHGLHLRLQRADRKAQIGDDLVDAVLSLSEDGPVDDAVGAVDVELHHERDIVLSVEPHVVVGMLALAPRRGAIGQGDLGREVGLDGKVRPGEVRVRVRVRVRVGLGLMLGVQGLG